MFVFLCKAKVAVLESILSAVCEKPLIESKHQPQERRLVRESLN